MKLLLALIFTSSLLAHDGPTPLLHYAFHQKFHQNNTLTAQQGPDLPLPADQTIPTPHGLAFPGTGTTPSTPAAPLNLPTKTFTATTWASVHQPTQYGGFIGAQEDNGNAETGWTLGYDLTHFYLSLSTKKTDDGDGRRIVIRSSQPYKKNTYYHLAATYDGSTASLYLNGKLDASSQLPGGPILYHPKTQLALAGYRDQNENIPLAGELISATLYRDLATPKWIAQEFQHNQHLTQQTPINIAQHQPLTSIISPYLQFATTTGITVMWETSKPATPTLSYGQTAECKNTITSEKNGPIHELRLENLQPSTQYFYRTTSTAQGPDGPQTLTSEVRTFQTASPKETPFAFAVISDTQGNPTVSGSLATQAWDHRPNFLLHPGDLVSTGGVKNEWVKQFFSSMEPLTSRVPFYPVLGNHEQNAANYYNYVSLPDPEYHYTFTYGNTQFFMVDTNKKCGPKSPQYQWLAKQLKTSTATWKILCHHHPAYTSDENDYGNLWKTNQSTRGDLNARHLAHLAHQHNVDLIWNGHIHSYERTWPLKNGKPVNQNGTIHLITGGGGGHLETHGPFRTPFANLLRRGHHYSMVWVNGNTLEYKAYTLKGLLFDTFTLKK